MTDARAAEVDQNFDAFEKLLPTLLSQRRGQFALMRGGVIAEFLTDQSTALGAAKARYPDGLFSIQEVTDRPADLGFFSHAINSRIA